MIDLTIGLKKSHHKRRLNRESRADFEAWLLFVQNFNGKSLILSDKWDTSETLALYTDSSNIGFGGYLYNKWFAGVWPAAWLEHHITIKELFPIVLAVDLFRDKFANGNVLFFSDNMAVVHIINAQTSKHQLIMCLVRRFVVLCLKYNIMFRAKHIPGLDNTLADKLSRQQVKEFLQLTPSQNPVEVTVPPTSLII